MDVGIFKASTGRLVAWIIVPPLVITTVGLSSLALQQRATWQLKETKELSNVLPDVMHARTNVKQLFDNLGLTKDKRIENADQLINLLEEKARLRRIVLKKTQVLEREKAKKSTVPTLSTMVEASGEFADFQLFLNDVLSAYPLISTRSIIITEADEKNEDEGFDMKVIFDLMLVEDVMKASGGSL